MGCFLGEPAKDSVDLSAFPTTQDQPKTRIAEACVEINNNNNNIYLLQLGCHPVAVVILHVNKT